MAKVSVIVPVYNGSDYIISTLDQILKSTMAEEVEVVVVNDGSTDASGELVKDYANTHPNIRYVEKENGGIVSARNRGVQESTGDYICFCDQDDIVPEDAYKAMYERAVKDDSDMVLTSAVRYLDGETTALETFDDCIYSKDEIIDNLILPILLHGTDYAFDPSRERRGFLWKSMIKREVIFDNNISFRRYFNYEDDEIFLIDCELNSKQITTIPVIGYEWRTNLGSESHRWKYLDKCDERYMNYVYDVVDMLRKHGCPEDKINLVLNYHTLNMYEQFMMNEGSPKNPASFSQKLKNIKAVVTKYDKPGVFDMRHHLFKISIRKRYAMMFLSHKMYFGAYCWTVGYKKFRERAIRNSAWFKIESFIKNRGK